MLATGKQQFQQCLGNTDEHQPTGEMASTHTTKRAFRQGTVQDKEELLQPEVAGSASPTLPLHPLPAAFLTFSSAVASASASRPVSLTPGASAHAKTASRSPASSMKFKSSLSASSSSVAPAPAPGPRGSGMRAPDGREGGLGRPMRLWALDGGLAKLWR